MSPRKEMYGALWIQEKDIATQCEQQVQQRRQQPQVKSALVLPVVHAVQFTGLPY